MGSMATAWVSKGASSASLYMPGTHVMYIKNSLYWRHPSRPTPATPEILGLRGRGSDDITGAGCSHGGGE